MLVIIHGWSSHCGKMVNVCTAIESLLGISAASIRLGDYLSLDDNVTFNDLTDALDRAWRDLKLPPGEKADVIVHSTGGLIIRDWLERRYGKHPETAPVKHLLMLAPANFGSPIAHMGQSGLGRIFAGWESEKGFESGKELLKGLELASAYSWQLANRDLFSEEARKHDQDPAEGTARLYDAGNIMCSVLVGGEGYSGISAIGNRPGGDGTVLWATANLNAAKITVDLIGKESKKRTRGIVADTHFDPTLFEDQNRKALCAFCIVPGFDHSSIADYGEKIFSSEAKEMPPELKAYILEALTVEEKDFETMKGAWSEKAAAFISKKLRDDRESLLESLVKSRIISSFIKPSKEETPEKAEKETIYDVKGGYQHCVVHVVDHHDAPVGDYVVELYAATANEAYDEEKLTKKIQEEVILSVHSFSDDPSYRSFYIDYARLTDVLDSLEENDSQKRKYLLKFSVTARPEISDEPAEAKRRHSVGYKTGTSYDVGSFSFSREQAKIFFSGTRTILITIKIRRYQNSNVFTLDKKETAQKKKKDRK